jgi:sugar phosphate isomerase/epimerase
MNKPMIAIQLYSVRDECTADFFSVLKNVAKMGYEGVEFAGYYGRSAADIKKILDKYKLKVAGTHTGIDSLLGDEFNKTVEFNKIIGNKYLIVPWLPEQYTNSKQAWLDTAKLFNDLSEKVKSEGMAVGYHNHDFEFKKIDGQYPFDIFFGATVPDVVVQLDTGNAMHGGVFAEHVNEFVKQYPGRLKTVHLKEYSAINPKALLGEGSVKFRSFIPLCETVGGTEWFIIEQESFALSPLEGMKRSLVNYNEIINM